MSDSAVTITTGGATATTMLIYPDGRTVVSSTTPWYRLFRALADLFLAGEIEIDELSDQAVYWSTTYDRETKGHYTRDLADPAARHILGSLALTWMEPNCLCDPYRETPCGCPPMDRRERLRELLEGCS